MSAAETLRKAAALMRERAEGANYIDGRWAVDVSTLADSATRLGPIYDALAATWKQAAHIASWRPAVALLAAEVLEDHAWEHDCYECGWAEPCAPLRLARAYLGADQ